VNSDNTIGLIAGNGEFPLLFAREARKHGQKVVAVALKEEADPSIEGCVDQVMWLSLGQLGKTISFFKEQGIRRAVMAGQVKHVQLFRGIVPDLRAVKVLAQTVNKKADTILSAVTQEFEREGIELLPSVTYLEDWLCPEGPLTTRKPSAAETADLAFGLPLARLMADQDIGQTIVVKDQTVVAIEAMEGTDACIVRAGQIAGVGCVVIKVARPRQDLRFDIPVVGPTTLQSMIIARAPVLALEAQKTLLLDKDNLLQAANASELCITGLRP
jgi:hypothetical protein